MVRNSHCSYCGNKFTVEAWPRTCSHCANISYINPLPVAALLVPVDGKGLLMVRRGEDPGYGQLALPGGYLDVGETWQEGAVRELREETGVVSNANEVELISVSTSLKHNSLLIFCIVPNITIEAAYKNFRPNREVTELVMITKPQELAFPTHTEIAKRHFHMMEIK